jgi:hypothetical protein
MAPLYKKSLKTFLKVIRMLIIALGIKDYFLINDGRVLYVQLMLQSNKKQYDFLRFIECLQSSVCVFKSFCYDASTEF